MRIIKPSVALINPPSYDSILAVVEMAGRVCYKSEHKITYGSAEKFVRGLIKRGHEAVIEHATATLRFICDRGVSHEIVRHRLASYCQESTRYCVAGNMTLRCKNPHQKYTIEDLYENKYNSTNGAWKRFQFKQYNEHTGELQYSTVKDVHFMGEKPCIKVKTRLGYEIVCTPDHEIFSGNGNGYVKAGDLHIGDLILVNGTNEAYKNRDWLYHQSITLNKTFVEIAREFGFNVNTLKKWARKFGLPKKGTGYFHIGRSPWNKGIQDPRQTEALMKYHHCGRRKDKILKADTKCYQKHKAERCAMCGIKEGLHVHHIDRNRENNDPENLITLCASCHGRIHTQNLEVAFFDTIVSIEDVGYEKVYDIEMNSEHHNFVANGVVVHNCNYGKDDFGSEITVIQPCYLDENSDAYFVWFKTMEGCEWSYFELLNQGCTAQEARAVLPNSLKTEVVMTANMREWRHFCKLRTAPGAHPQMREVAGMALHLLKKNYPVFFEDFENV